MGRQFTSLRRVMGGFLPPPPEPERVAVRDEGVAETLRHVEILGRLILRTIHRLETQMADQNVTTQQILDAVRAQRGQIASLSTLIGGIKARLNAALEGQISPDAQAKLNDIMSEIQGNTRAITDAVATNDDDPTTVASDGSGGQTGPAETGKAATSTSLSTSKAVVQAGEAVSLSAGVSAASGIDKPITGTVTFASEGEEIGKAGLDSTGAAALSVSDLPAGDHVITATYGGDANFASSTSQEITQSVMPASTETPAPQPEPAPATPGSTGDAPQPVA
jgi:hypothetical protein